MSEFLVFSASAGSGKTFMLVRKYLQQAFSSAGDYSRILAVTFTNKAADEMKGRILTELDLLDKSPSQSHHLSYLTDYFNKSEQWVQETARDILSQMLHDYARISVGTIDSFFQQILRSFARESGLSSTFELELDTHLVLEQFSHYIFNEAIDNNQLMSWLIDWVNERMENRETWHKLEAELFRLGTELLKEDILTTFIQEKEAFPTPEKIAGLKAACRKTIREYKEAKKSIADQATRILDQSGFSVEDFSFGMSGPTGYLLKLAEDKESSTTRAFGSLNAPDKWVGKNKPAAIRAAIIDQLYPELNQLMSQAIQLYESQNTLYQTAKSINRNLYALGLTSFIFNYFKSYSKDNDHLLLSFTQPTINQIIDGNPSPFIYEKTGTYYNHFLIDEFQDTSDLQWQNFKPLIKDSLSAGGLSMVVGDIKQSLYRWRNSNWRLLYHQAVDDMHAFGSQLTPLNKNQRSRQSIIDFNNDIFSGLPARVAENFTMTSLAAEPVSENRGDIIRQVFQEAKQEAGNKAGLEGKVEIRFIDKSDQENNWNDILSQNLVDTVKDLLTNRGYRQEDITFLVRKNSDADKISRILTQAGNNWTFASTDVFRISNAPVIKMIVNAIRYIADPSLTLFKDLFFWDVFSRNHPDETPFPGFQSAEENRFQSYLESVAHNDLLTIVDHLIQTYSLDTAEEDMAYLYQFRDQIKSCMMKGISHPDGFIAWWDLVGYKQMLASDSLGSSMRIMTVHKAKGLSSPVIIVPYCNWDFNHSASKAPWLWVSTAGTPFTQVGKIPVRYDSTLELSLFNNCYIDEKIDCYLDNLNLLYVAFTRAVDILIAFCPFGKSFKNVADALYAYLNNRLDDHLVYRLGNPEFCNPVLEHPMPQDKGLPVPMIMGHLKSKVKQAENKIFLHTQFGNNVHHVLESMIKPSDLEQSIGQAVLDGYFSSDEALEVKSIITRLFDIPEIKKWFTDDWEILNEAAILIPGNGERRPDRVMINDSGVVVLDYKTGTREPGHDKQVSSYMKLLNDMGYQNIRGFLLYLDSASLIEVNLVID